MHVHSTRQIVHADPGSTIQNVTQIIEGGKPDVDFSCEAAERIPNRLGERAVSALIKKELERYFWKPPGLADALATLQVQGLSVPLWRLQGEVSASWRVWIEEVMQRESDNKEQTTQTKQLVPRDRFMKKEVDWMIPACGTASGILRTLIPAFQTISKSQQSVHVDWCDYPFGESLERLWPRFRLADVLGLWQHKLSVNGAVRLFVDGASVLSLPFSGAGSNQTTRLTKLFSLSTSRDLIN